MNRIARLLALSLVAAAIGLLVPGVASAHERRDIADGRYTLVVGFSSEPAYTGFLNGLDLRVTDNSITTPDATTGEAVASPVEFLEESLQAEVIYGDQKMALTIEPRFRAPGQYDAWIIPTAAGDYTFHIWGTIGETTIDETFTSSPEGFASVADQSTIHFPQAAASTSAPMFGTVSDNDGGLNASLIGAVAGCVALCAAAGLFLISQRGRAASARAGTGD